MPGTWFVISILAGCGPMSPLRFHREAGRGTSRRSPGPRRVSGRWGAMTGRPQPGTPSAVGDRESSRQSDSPARGLGRQRSRLRLGSYRRARRDGDQIHQVLEARGWVVAGPVPLDYRGHLVGDVIDERVRTVTVLFNVWHDDSGEWRDRLGFARHLQIGSDQVDVELGPRGCADKGPDREAGTRRPVGGRL